MKLLVSVLLSLVLSAHSNLMRNIRQPKEITQRRLYNGYSNSIIHENPNYPDQTAQSSVKVNFNPNQIEQRQPIYNHYTNQQDFSQDYIQNYPTNAPQSQLFNVGYSVSFTNNKQPQKPQIVPKYTRTNLDDGEIITGIRKQNEQVQSPNFNISPHDFVSTALIGSKKQKISGIKPKPHFATNYPNPKVLLTQANLSPATQKYYKTLEQLKPHIQNTQDLQQKYSWRNLSPGVEIIRSTEVPTGQKFVRPDLHFDHAKALGRSQDFDYTNAVDNNSNIPQPSTLFYNHLKKSKLTSPQQIPSLGFAGINQNVNKIPIDTTLLKNPVQVDTRLVEEAMKNQLALYTNSKYTQPQQQVQDVSYFQQAYRTIPVHEDTQTIPNNPYQSEEIQGFQDYQPNQSRFQYKVYGKPQPVISGFNEPQSEQILRQPRYLSDLSTNLRPPPFATVPYQRRIHVVG